MIEKYNVRTDLALEQKERFDSDHVEVQGVVLEEEYDEESEICVTTVKIETENGARTMKRPVGTYITVEVPEMAVPDEDYHREISVKLKSLLTRFVQVDKEDYSVLVVGLGNRQVTPDALGPFVADHLNITRHVVKEYGKYAMGEEAIHLVSAIVPGLWADRDGDGGNHPRCSARDEAGSHHCGRCIGGKKFQTFKQNDPDCGYRDSSGFGSW